MGSMSSNHDELLAKALNFSLKLPSTWASATVNEKDSLQKLMFPDGVTYNRKNGTFQTDKVNEVFRYIAALNSVPEDNKKRQSGNETDLSSLVGMTGFEPAAPSSRTTCATGLRYIPLQVSRHKIPPPSPYKFHFHTSLIKKLMPYPPESLILMINHL